MKHKKIKELLGAYLDGELEEGKQRIVEEHLKVCIECSEQLEALRLLNKKVKEEKIPLPPEGYWDNFSKRVMGKLKQKRSPGFFFARIPRLKWELAGGVVLILLTFIVSRHIIEEKGLEWIGSKREIITAEKRPTDKLEIAGEEEKAVGEKGGVETYHSPKSKAVSRASDETEGTITDDEMKKKDVSVAKKGVATAKEKPPATGYFAETSRIAKSAEGESEKSAVAGGVSNEEVSEQRAVVMESKAEPEITEKREKIDLVADIKQKEELLTRTQDRDKSLHIRRGLLRMLYVEADRSRKREDIKRAIKEVEAYKDSYPDEFADTLVMFRDSLIRIMEEVEKEERE
jgi:hypothetical protein